MERKTHYGAYSALVLIVWLLISFYFQPFCPSSNEAGKRPLAEMMLATSGQRREAEEERREAAALGRRLEFGHFEEGDSG
jgi:hypothetical protein